MSSNTITIPSFDFSAFYYAEILEALTAYARINVPELTDESIEEPFTQIKMAFALVGHLNNVLIDLVANESTLPTAKLTESVRNMLRLIDYELQSATPAQVDIIYELSKVFTASYEIISQDAQSAIRQNGDDPIIYFEAEEALTINPTNVFDYVFGEEDEVFTDYTTEANSQVTPGDDWQPWTTPAIKDCLYFGHENIMWNELSIFLTTFAAGITGVWEYYDGDWSKISPTSVTDNGSTLEIDLTSLLGTQNRQGTVVRVLLNSTAVYEDVESVWTGLKNIATVGLLGQTTPSVDENHYSVGSDWSIFGTFVDGSSEFTQNGILEIELPQNENENWIQTEINGSEAFWIRFRIITVSSPTNPVFQYCRLDTGKQYVVRNTVQGRTILNEIIGSSTGLPNQEFETSREYFIFNSESLEIDGEAWTRVENFLSSQATDKHYVVKLGENDKAIIEFGDGQTGGKIPPIGVSNVVLTKYRYNAEENGNVGANTVTVDKTGLTFVNKLWNPRQATGWKEAQGANEASLEKAKVDGPASLRTKSVALTPDDLVDLTIAYIDENGSSPFSRAIAIEEAYGPKTVMLVVVAAGGGQASATLLGDIEVYFNGDKYSYPKIKKKFAPNQEITAINYSEKIIDVTATVYGNVSASSISNELIKKIQPEALKADGINWEWEFGEKVPTSKINSIIFNANSTITKVDVTQPSTDVLLQSLELPKVGTISINVIKPE